MYVESNFPVDKQSISYHVLWNFFKKSQKILAKMKTVCFTIALKKLINLMFTD